MKIFLIGFMASGKSTTGRKAAREAGCGFVDLDEMVEQQAGCTVDELFAGQGRWTFRQWERACLKEACGMKGRTIIATGGGTPCTKGNMETMHRAGITIYLKFSPEELTRRIELSSEKGRPLLAGRKGEELLRFVTECLAQREPTYEQATYTLRGSDEELVAQVAAIASSTGQPD